MQDLISRQAAIDAIRCDITITGRQNAELVAATIGAFADRIKALPSAQPEQKKGVWIRHPEQKNIFGGKTVECSVCGEKYVVQYIEDEKFCRSCGADMRGEQDE